MGSGFCRARSCWLRRNMYIGSNASLTDSILSEKAEPWNSSISRSVELGKVWLDMRMMFEEDAFDHVEFILCIQFIGASKGSEARLYQWSFVNIVQATGAIGWVWVRQLQITRCPPVHLLATAYVPPCLPISLQFFCRSLCLQYLGAWSFWLPQNLIFLDVISCLCPRLLIVCNVVSWAMSIEQSCSSELAFTRGPRVC